MGLLQFCDNKSTIFLTKNLVIYERNKYIEIKYYFTRDLVTKEEIKLEYCEIEDQILNIFMKPLKS